MEGHDKIIDAPNDYLRSWISSLVASSKVTATIAPRIELDSHDNMTVLGRHCFIFDGVHGKTCDVEPFDSSIGTAKKVHVVDTAISHNCPYLHQTFILIIRNA